MFLVGLYGPQDALNWVEANLSFNPPPSLFRKLGTDSGAKNKGKAQPGVGG